MSFRMIGSFRPDLYRMLISGVDQYLPSLLLYYFATALLLRYLERSPLELAPIGDRSLDRSGAIFPLLPLRGGPLGPRLRKWHSPTETGSCPICGASLRIVR